MHRYDVIEAAARAAHEANRAYCVALDARGPLAWDLVPEAYRTSARAGVREILRSPYVTCERLHDLWCDRMEDDGWTYGPALDAESKQHPLLVAYSELSIEQQALHVLWAAVVRAMLGALLHGGDDGHGEES